MVKTEKMAKLKVTQIRSTIGATKKQKGTMQALGLTRMRQSVEHEDTPNINGMINKVKHLISVEEA